MSSEQSKQQFHGFEQSVEKKKNYQRLKHVASHKSWTVNPLFSDSFSSTHSLLLELDLQSQYQEQQQEQKKKALESSRQEEIQ